MTARLERRLRAAFGGRVVVVTGASRGIGAAAARMLGAAGARVVLLARDAEALEELASGIRAAGGDAATVPLELRDATATAETAHRILAEHGAPALVLANAGHSIRRTARDSAGRAHDVQRTVAANYTGHAALLLELLPAMRASGRGRVVVSSTAALAVPAPGWSAYVASKAALERWIRDVDAETRPEGVTFGAVRLPLVRTAMSAPTAAYREARAMSADRAARMLLVAALGRRRLVQAWWVGLVGFAATLAPGLAERVGRRWQRRLAAAQEAG
ncbi:SDR family NAD(P)-dependent oxidoreductase [Protaetiibacter intestinalis]|uniref:SDR family NAD(P)-dependent oxidoreductase n=1 Tax=Protaetiibacter intestinalis TaxID=2419774 RepID=A0A387BA11_9MICO|nr:SDR family NAD(P)-dependent oxidoreductase [Protaetiibacter intestinalis]AYF98578.1 SDR family NAD(P)-dependent oxidoreductase [Protaetiibacter intestinalis]